MHILLYYDSIVKKTLSISLYSGPHGLTITHKLASNDTLPWPNIRNALVPFPLAAASSSGQPSLVLLPDHNNASAQQNVAIPWCYFTSHSPLISGFVCAHDRYKNIHR